MNFRTSNKTIMRFFNRAVLAFSLIFTISCSSGAESENSKKTPSKEDSNLLAMVLIDGKYGYINPQGTYVVEPKYSLARSFSNGYACVNEGGKRTGFGTAGGQYYFIDKEGNKAFNGLSTGSPISFYESFAKIEAGNGNFGFINLEGDIAIEGFSIATNFNEGLALAASLDGQTSGYINKKGEWAIQLENGASFNNYGIFNNGLALFFITDSITNKRKVGFINKKGQVAIEAIFESAYPFKNGFAVVMMNDKLGFIDTHGKIVVECTLEDCDDFSEGLAPILKEGKWGFINTKGEVVIDCKFESLNSFSDGLAAVLENGKVGFIDKDGKWAIKPKYENVQNFKNGYAIVQQNRKLGFIDLDGNEITPLHFTRVDNFVNPEESNPVIKVN